MREAARRVETTSTTSSSRPKEQVEHHSAMGRIEEASGKRDRAEWQDEVGNEEHAERVLFMPSVRSSKTPEELASAGKRTSDGALVTVFEAMGKRRIARHHMIQKESRNLHEENVRIFRQRMEDL